MAMTPARRVALAALVLAGSATLAYLRDPAWLMHSTQGLGSWRSEEAGRRFRWSGGHASFFVPADAAVIEITLAAAFDLAKDRAVVATITIDGQPAQRVELSDGNWRTLEISLPPPGSRRARRVDIRVDRTRRDGLAFKLGEIRSRS
jgi:hypothetical protein